VVERSPSTQSYLLLGDAYMAITEPERALEVYEQVNNKNLQDIHFSAEFVFEKNFVQVTLQSLRIFCYQFEIFSNFQICKPN
jgi:hypothetical protein